MDSKGSRESKGKKMGEKASSLVRNLQGVRRRTFNAISSKSRTKGMGEYLKLPKEGRVRGSETKWNGLSTSSEQVCKKALVLDLITRVPGRTETPVGGIGPRGMQCFSSRRGRGFLRCRHK